MTPGTVELAGNRETVERWRDRFSELSILTELGEPHWRQEPLAACSMPAMAEIRRLIGGFGEFTALAHIDYVVRE